MLITDFQISNRNYKRKYFKFIINILNDRHKQYFPKLLFWTQRHRHFTTEFAGKFIMVIFIGLLNLRNETQEARVGSRVSYPNVRTLLIVSWGNSLLINSDCSKCF